MSEPLPEPCPRIPATHAMDGERCGLPKILEDENQHICYLKVTHDSKHVGWCGRDWAR